jgi:hypothetical protein
LARYRFAAPAALASASELFLAAGNEIAVQKGTHLDGHHEYTVRLGAQWSAVSITLSMALPASVSASSVFSTSGVST